MDAVTSDKIREWSKIDFGALGYPAGSPDPLDELMARAGAFFGEITGLGFDPVEDAALVAVPPRLDPLVRQAVQRMVELLAMQGQPDVVETLADFQLIGSFSAGQYSETRRSLSEVSKNPMIVGDPGLNSLLWTLMTPDKQGFWFAFLNDLNEPAWDIQEVWWGAPHVLSGWDAPWNAPARSGPAVDWARDAEGF